MTKIWIIAGLFAILPAYGSESTVRELLVQAKEAAGTKNSTEAYNVVREAINDPSFAKLEEGEQHSALELAYESAWNAKDYPQAHEYASRATALPQGALADWRYRLSSAFRVKDAADEAICITNMVRQWGPGADGLTPKTVRFVYRDTKGAKLSEARKSMLLALYDYRWQPGEGNSASYLWLALTRLLLESNEFAKAAQVVILVDDPADVIAIRADRRYGLVLKAAHFESDPLKAAKSRIKVLRDYTAQHPRSLNALLNLIDNLAKMREDKAALQLATQADQKIMNAGTGAAPFDDVKKYYAWIISAKAKSLQHMGEFQLAATELRRALEVPHPDDNVSQAINLAILLCELGRSEEAVGLLPKMEDASEYGKLQIARVGLMAAAVRNDSPSVQQLLEFLSDHQEANPSTYQEGLLMAGEYDKAEKVLLSRLADPETRTEALLQLQTYSDHERPALAQAWHEAFKKLKSRPSVQQAAAQVGSLDSYLWRYD